LQTVWETAVHVVTRNSVAEHEAQFSHTVLVNFVHRYCDGVDRQSLQSTQLLSVFKVGSVVWYCVGRQLVMKRQSVLAVSVHAENLYPVVLQTLHLVQWLLESGTHCLEMNSSDWRLRQSMHDVWVRSVHTWSWNCFTEHLVHF